jgi:hypothetical protein
MIQLPNDATVDQLREQIQLLSTQVTHFALAARQNGNLPLFTELANLHVGLALGIQGDNPRLLEQVLASGQDYLQMALKRHGSKEYFLD